MNIIIKLNKIIYKKSSPFVNIEYRHLPQILQLQNV
jgi:hypothetical protein